MIETENSSCVVCFPIDMCQIFWSLNWNKLDSFFSTLCDCRMKILIIMALQSSFLRFAPFLGIVHPLKNLFHLSCIMIWFEWLSLRQEGRLQINTQTRHEIKRSNVNVQNETMLLVTKAIYRKTFRGKIS